MSSLVRSPITGLSDSLHHGGFASALRFAGSAFVNTPKAPTGPPDQPPAKRIARSIADLPRPVLSTFDLAVSTAITIGLGLPLVLIPIWGVALAMSRGRVATRSVRELGRHVVRTGVSALALGGVSAYFLGLGVARPDLLTGVVAFAFASMLVNALPILARRAIGLAVTRAVLVGSSAQVEALLGDLSRPGGEQLQVAGVCLTDRDLEPVDRCDIPRTFEVTHGLESISPAMQVLEADVLLAIPGPDLGPLELRRLAWQAERLGARFHVDSGLVDTASTRTQIIAAGSARLVEVSSTSPAPVRRGIKTVWEWSLSVLLLLVALPVLMVLMVAIRADRGGPALFRQERVGLDGKAFTLIKLRTMLPEAEDLREDLADLNESDGVLFKMRADPRITRVGGMLRKYSLDELPQLWNVVRGDMALVGPRPALPGEVAKYAHDTHRRLAVKPGLTGLWQVSGRSNLSWEETERIDLKYVDNWSLALDASIVARTAKAVIGHQGAY